ncbi:MAG: hypothetical protein AAF797_02520 [Planctomycetota bacterium]
MFVIGDKHLANVQVRHLRLINSRVTRVATPLPSTTAGPNTLLVSVRL